MADVGRHGDGGVTKRADGRLQVSITLTTGRRIYRTIPRLTDPKRQKELAERARRELVTMREAELDPAGQTLADYLRSWLRSMADARNARIRPNTLIGYTTIAELHLIPVLGDHRLENLRERHVQAWLDGLALSPQYVTHCRSFLRRVLNVAERQRIIARNPAKYVELPPIPRYRAKAMTAADARKLLAATADDRLAALWRLALVTGLRVGELLALSWDDVDLGGHDGQSDIHAGPTQDDAEGGHRADVLLRRLPDRGPAGEVAQPLPHREAPRGPSITVTARLARLNGEWVRAETKAARELQTIAIDAGTAALLDAHKLRQAAERKPDWAYWGLVFVTPSGMPLDGHLVMAAFRDACDRAGIERRRVHDIRHSNATIMRDVGISSETRKARHGHSTDEMDARYSGPSAAQDRAAVERFAEAIG